MALFAWYRRIPLVYLNIGAFIFGIVLGLGLWRLGDALGQEVVGQCTAILAPFGTVLVALLKMIVIPIIFFSLMVGAASLPLRKFGTMGLAVILWYLATSLYAAFFGTFMAWIFNPKMANAAATAAKLLPQVDSMRQAAAADCGNPFLNLLYSLFMNPFQALAEGRFLPIIVFAILFGLAARAVIDAQPDSRDSRIITMMLDIAEAMQRTIFKMIEWVMLYFPVGILALTTVNFAIYGAGLFSSYFQVALCVIVGIVLMLLVCYPLLIFVICRENPYRLLLKLKEPILTAFVTRSSAATLPVSFKVADETLRIKPQLSGFTLSLGATVNMDGVCLHLPVFAVLAANMFGVELGPIQVLLLVLSVVFASIGAGGVPGGSIFLLFMVLEAFNLPQAQVAVIVALALGINPLLDMFETACNVAGDNIGNYVIGRKLGMIRDDAEKS